MNCLRHMQLPQQHEFSNLIEYFRASYAENLVIKNHLIIALVNI